MVKLRVEDEANYLCLSEGFVPEIERIRSVLSAKNPLTNGLLRVRTPRFAENETAVAWALCTYARRVLQRHFKSWGRGEMPWDDWLERIERGESASEDDYMRAPINLWILGYPETSDPALSPWYDGEQADTSYRLLIHQSPKRIRDMELPDLWRSTYYSPIMRAKLKVRSRESRGQIVAPELKQTTMLFLEQILKAYGQGRDEVHAVFEDCGHPCWHSASIMAKIGEYEWIATGLTEE